jgi:membrane protein implicated in regulation of membrane protease activity
MRILALMNWNTYWFWIAGAILIVLIVWLVIKTIRERNPTEKQAGSGTAETPKEPLVGERIELQDLSENEKG